MSRVITTTNVAWLESYVNKTWCTTEGEPWVLGHFVLACIGKLSLGSYIPASNFLKMAKTNREKKYWNWTHGGTTIRVEFQEASNVHWSFSHHAFSYYINNRECRCTPNLLQKVSWFWYAELFPHVSIGQVGKEPTFWRGWKTKACLLSWMEFKERKNYRRTTVSVTTINM